jgi:hypothetical protein
MLKDLAEINTIWAALWLSAKAAFADASPRVFRRFTKKLAARLFFFFVKTTLESLRANRGALTPLSKQFCAAADYFRHQSIVGGHRNCPRLAQQLLEVLFLDRPLPHKGSKRSAALAQLSAIGRA